MSIESGSSTESEYYEQIDDMLYYILPKKQSKKSPVHKNTSQQHTTKNTTIVTSNETPTSLHTATLPLANGHQQKCLTCQAIVPIIDKEDSNVEEGEIIDDDPNWIPCQCCHQSYPTNYYSKAQLTKGYFSKRCKLCINSWTKNASGIFVYDESEDIRMLKCKLRSNEQSIRDDMVKIEKIDEDFKKKHQGILDKVSIQEKELYTGYPRLYMHLQKNPVTPAIEKEYGKEHVHKVAYHVSKILQCKTRLDYIKAQELKKLKKRILKKREEIEEIKRKVHNDKMKRIQEKDRKRMEVTDISGGH